MVCLLLDAPPGSTVSIEVFDDIGITYENGDRLAEQAKSTTSSHNPISNFSKDLWKTFNNWLDSISQGELSVDQTAFEIYLSIPQKGKFAYNLSSAKTPQEISDILDNIHQEFCKKKEEGNTLSKEVVAYVEKVVNYDKDILYKLFQNFRLEVGTGSVWSELAEILQNNKAIPNDIVEDVGIHLLGWVKKISDELLQNNKPAAIQEETFRSELQAIIRKLDRGNILFSFAPNLEQEQIESQKTKTYVLQLGIIEAQEDEKLQAINDYLKAAYSRTEWSKKGYVSSSSFQEFENSLRRTWDNSKKRILLSNKDLNDIEKGKLLLIDCYDCKNNLQGQVVDDSFVAGSFHVLADGLEIGWHPFYTEILSKLGIKGSN